MNSTEKFIPWGPGLLTGITSIDEQHRVLVDMCNEAHELLQSQSTTESIKRMVRDLMSYALYHFETEEELAIRHGYQAGEPEQNTIHRLQHRAFASAVADMQTEMSRGNGISVETLFDFLRTWLTQHIQGTDMQLADFLLRHAQPLE